jgi:D-glycero-D-manno-heptose 1,7-bisphosphate phosphatase
MLYIFDADGTLRRTIGHNSRPPLTDEEWELMPGVQHKLGEVGVGRQNHFAVASNQSVVGRGYISLTAAHKLLMSMAVAATGLIHPSNHIRLCPHTSNDGCACRKPEPGMLIDLMKEFDVPPGEVLFVGNAITDCLAAINAGCQFMWAKDFFEQKEKMGVYDE